MESSIDITDSTFALGANDLFSNVDMSQTGDYSDHMFYIFIVGMFILGVVFGWFIYYKFLKKSHVNDCEGGFCTMSSHNDSS